MQLDHETIKCGPYAPAFRVLANELSALSTEHNFIYIPNPGNRGDALIRYATRKFFEDNDIVVSELNLTGAMGKFSLIPSLLGSLSNRTCYIVGGGGAWSEAYGFGYKLTKFLSRFRAPVFVLPSSFQLSHLSSQNRYFRRDEFESEKVMPHSLFCHDMAFYLYGSEIVRTLASLRPSSAFGIFLRRDKERALPIRYAHGREDISASGDHMSNADSLLLQIANHETIVTDRLHVAIGGLLLKRKVNLFSGNYFKIEAIYKSSIQPYVGDLVELRSPDEITRFVGE